MNTRQPVSGSATRARTGQMLTAEAHEAFGDDVADLDELLREVAHLLARAYRAEELHTDHAAEEGEDGYDGDDHDWLGP